MCLARNVEQAMLGIIQERGDGSPLFRQYLSNRFGAGVADLDPDDFWRRSVLAQQIFKISVLGKDVERVLAGIMPDIIVVGFGQLDIRHMHRTGKLIPEGHS